MMDDLVALRPTIFCSVPRLYNRIYAGINNAVKSSGGLRERLFNVAFNSKKQALMNGQNPSPIWDKLVFNKIKEKLGGRVRLVISGSAPISPDVLDFLRVCFGCPVIEGYGMTETSCVISMMDPGDFLSGHVGSPGLASVQMRMKKLFFLFSRFIGDSFNASLVAVVCVDPDVLKGWAAAEGIKYEDLAQLCRHPRTRAAADMDATGRDAGLRGFELAKAVTLVRESLTVEGGLLTPTMKIKRPQAKEHFTKGDI